MFVYLSKKIAIPNNTQLTSLSWNINKGYIACGGEEGLLKVLKLDPQIEGNVRGIAAPTTLTMNDTLEEHKRTITNITWNDRFDKLTTSDEGGVIIVWILFRNNWQQEMINNSNKSRVNGMKWNVDGEKICIIYEDGAIIVGSVDGSRIWGKSIADKLAHVEWSPDSRFMLFGLVNGEIHTYDNGGNKIAVMQNYCNTNDTTIAIVGMHWYKGEKGYMRKNCPCLAICYDNGCCQIMRNETDEYPVLINTGLQAKCLAWNGNGTVLAIGGFQEGQAGSKDSNVVQFYDPFGYHLRTLKIPCKDLHSCSWDSESLRVAVAVDSSIYFANIRPTYKWACCTDTVIYSFTRPEKSNYSVVFWNTKNDSCHTKFFAKLKSIVSCGNLCCVIHQADNENTKHKYVLQLCNSIGTPIDEIEIGFEPVYQSMTSSHVIVASFNVVYSWQFKRPENLLTMESQVKRKNNIDNFRHIDDNQVSINAVAMTESKLNSDLQKLTDNPICSICASKSTLIVARETGEMKQYTMPLMDYVTTHRLKSRPFKLEMNCTETRVASIDFGGVLSFFDLDKSFTDSRGDVRHGVIVENFEYKDVWDMKFAEDNPLIFVMMEKTKLRIIQDLVSEEPIVFSGYICEFKELEVKAVLLDDLVNDYDNPSKDYFIIIEAKILRDCRKLLEDGQLERAQEFTAANPHNKMWKLLAEYALEKLDLDNAEQFFVLCTYYPGIKFVKKLRKLQNNNIKMAAVSVYFGRYEEAEKRYMAMGRSDLAITMLKSIGDWSKVLQLMKSEDGASDAQMNEAWTAIGDQYFDKHNWTQAVNYFTQGRCYVKLVECYYYLEDYTGLEKLAESLPENSLLLSQIADIFLNAGMCNQAVYAYLKSDQIKSAIDCCIQLNHWQTAIELAKNRDVTDINEMLTRYAKKLLDNHCYVQAVELYRRAGCFLDAAKIVQKLTEEESKKSKDYRKLKKMAVLVGLLIEQHHEQNKQQAKARLKDVRGQEAASALNGMLHEEFVGVSESRLLDRPWHWAEAFHFYLLAQRQLFQKYFDAAMRTSKLLSDYEDVIPAREIYSLMAICSIHNRAFGTCSKAFTKLETLDCFSVTEKDNLTQLTFKIFTKYSPTDPARAREYDDLENNPENIDSKIPICVVSGQPIAQGQFWMCPICKHPAQEDEISKHHNCPLCHSEV